MVLHANDARRWCWLTWLRNKYKLRRRRGGSYPLQHLYEHFGLVRLANLKHGGSWAKA